ncbi:response regulator [Kinneretia aquatilis]|uniref:response regulator n=1 Tax=Kinneretia aquatilis TaxID=2070761 RepID=UPI001495247E|nr:response regulator [Paucibacter aquatile]WIV99669.1 response regulator [Paucibacter aquatile]
MDSNASSTATARLGSPDPVILIVDDTPPNIGLLHTMLRPQGYRIYAASSGLQALELVERIQPDLILLDVMMPGMDGFATCRALKARSATADVPVIFITACTESEDVVLGFQAGAADYIAKPIRVEEVLARVQTQLALRRCAQQERAEQQQLRAIVESMREGLLLLDPQGSVRYSNPALQEQLGRSAVEIQSPELGRLLRQALPASGQGQVHLAQGLCGSVPLDLTLAPWPGDEAGSVALLRPAGVHS